MALGTPNSSFARFKNPTAKGSSPRVDEMGHAIPEPLSEDFGLGMTSPEAGFGGGWGGGGIEEQDFGGGGPGAMTKLSPPPMMGYAAGGAIDETTGDVGMGPMGGNFSSQLAAAVKACQDALNFGRQRMGIMGGSEQKEAGLNRMPTTPGNPSESGEPRELPAPGPLPPTSNPFGKRRAEAGGEGEEAIPTDDEETA